jgi:lysophospholipase L1-like esterase
MAWSGTGFVAKIDGTGLRITQTGPAVHYTVVADQMVMPEFVSPDGNQSSDVVTGLPAGEHIIEVYRQGEASFGETTLTKVEAIDGSMLPPPPAPQRRIEIFGDSITAGYGNEGTSTDCPFSAETENHYLTYGALLARQFNAELSTVAWSGKGIVSNYGGDKSTFLPQMLDRAIPSSETSVWDYSLAAPAQLVIVNLGTNDYSTDNDPTTADFVAGYTAMLQTIRTRYPGAFILCTNGPLLSGEDLSTVRTNIQAAVDQLSSGGDSAIRAFELQPENPSPGCDWHPSLATHEAMAAELATPIQSFLGW